MDKGSVFVIIACFLRKSPQDHFKKSKLGSNHTLQWVTSQIKY